MAYTHQSVELSVELTRKDAQARMLAAIDKRSCVHLLQHFNDQLTHNNSWV